MAKAEQNLYFRIGPLAVLFGLIILAGGLGFRLIEGWSWSESIYMAIITVSTVGYGEVHPLSIHGKLFTACLIIAGVGIITCSLPIIIRYLFEGEFRGIIKAKKMNKYIRSLSGHYVVCGYGAIGRQICAELKKENHEILVVEHDPETVALAEADGFYAIEGDACSNEILINSGVENARGLVIATNEDSTNLLVVLTARGLQANLHIVARTNRQEVTGKLLRAGADKVLFPQAIAGSRMAQLLTRPGICEFLEIVFQNSQLELTLESLEVESASPVENLSIQEAGIREKCGVTVIGMTKPDGTGTSMITPETILGSKNTAILLGTKVQMEMARELFSS
jgi:voltage-gated potassium channel